MATYYACDICGKRLDAQDLNDFGGPMHSVISSRDLGTSVVLELCTEHMQEVVAFIDERRRENAS